MEPPKYQGPNEMEPEGRRAHSGSGGRAAAALSITASTIAAGAILWFVVLPTVGTFLVLAFLYIAYTTDHPSSTPAQAEQIQPESRQSTPEAPPKQSNLSVMNSIAGKLVPDQAWTGEAPKRSEQEGSDECLLQNPADLNGPCSYLERRWNTHGKGVPANLDQYAKDMGLREPSEVPCEQKADAAWTCFSTGFSGSYFVRIKMSSAGAGADVKVAVSVELGGKRTSWNEL